MDPIATTTELMDPYKILMSFNFWLIAMVNFGIVVTIKQTLKKINQAHKLDTVWADIALVSLPLWLGGIIGYFILDDSLAGGVRILVGVTAGFLNPVAMKMLEKVAPTWVVSAYDPARNNGVVLPSQSLVPRGSPQEPQVPTKGEGGG